MSGADRKFVLVPSAHTPLCSAATIAWARGADSTVGCFMQMEGVAGYFDHTSVPGSNDLGTVIHDEEVFASSIVTCIGHPIGVIVADTEAHARAAARAVTVSYEDIPAVLSIEQAIAAGSFYDVRSWACGSLLLVAVGPTSLM